MRLDERRESLGLSVDECAKRLKVKLLAECTEFPASPKVWRKLYTEVLNAAEKEKSNAQ